MPVGAMLASMGSREISEWFEYARLEPFGPLREDQRAGEIAVRLANAYRPQKQKKAFQIWDIFPSLKDFRQTESLVEKFRRIAGV